MTPRLEKMLMTALSAGLAIAAHYFADDQGVRTLLMFLAGAPAGGVLIPRKEERDLKKIAQYSRPH